MLKDLKSKRRLSLFVALTLSAGGALFSDFQYAYAADVSGGDVVYDSGNPLPADPIAGGVISPSTTDPGNVHDNILTIDGLNISSRYVFGGYTTGIGDSTNNEVILKNTIATNGYYPANIYGGFSAYGNATNNTVTLAGASGNSAHRFVTIHGGSGGGTGKDFISGNLLQVKGKGNLTYGINNFEKMKFVLNSDVASGDTMLVNDSGMQAIDWNKVSVENAATWGAGDTISQRVRLYTGVAFGLSNYGTSPSTGTSGDFEYGLTTNTSTPTASNVTASELYFDRNKFKNANVIYDTDPSSPTLPATGVIFAGTSTLGNTTTNNKLAIDGLDISSRSICAGYTPSATGDSTNNEVILKNAIATNGYYPADIYGGFSAQGNATNNTVTLAGSTGNSGHRFMTIHGGVEVAPAKIS